MEMELNRKKFFYRLAMFIVFIFLVNLMAMKFHWYYSLWWFDMPMHFFGGFWLAGLYLWFDPIREPDIRSVFKVLAFVFFVGLLWEVFEVAVNMSTAKDPFDLVDTFSDICFDMSGGFSAIIYFFSRIMISINNRV